jgi:hypothetical protein
MVKPILRPLFKSAIGNFPRAKFTPGSSLGAILPLGATYFDVTQERFPGDVTEDISTDLNVVSEEKNDPVTEKPQPKPPTVTETQEDIEETEKNIDSMTTNTTVGAAETGEASRDAENNPDITSYIDNDSLKRINNYKDIINNFLGESSGGDKLQQTALLLQLGTSLMTGRTDQPGLRGFFDVVGQAGAQTAPMLFQMGLEKQKAEREISSAALDLYFKQLDDASDRSGPYVNVYQAYETTDDGFLKLDDNNQPIRLKQPKKIITVKRTSPEESKFYKLNQDLGFNVYEFVEPGEGTDAFGMAFTDTLATGKGDTAAQAASLDYAKYLQRALPTLAEDIIPMMIDRPELLGSRGALGKALGPYYETLKEFNVDLLKDNVFTVREQGNGTDFIPGLGEVNIFIDYNNDYKGNGINEIDGGDFGSIDVSDGKYGYDENNNPVKAYIVAGDFEKMLKSSAERSVLETFETTLGLMLARDRQPTGRMLADVLKRSFADVSLTGSRAAGGQAVITNYIRIYKQLYDNMAGALAYAGRTSDNYPSLYQVKGSKTLENSWYDYLTKDGRELPASLKYDLPSGQTFDQWFSSNTGNIMMNNEENKQTSGNYMSDLRNSLGLQ